MGQIDEQDVDIISDSSKKSNNTDIQADSKAPSAVAKMNNFTDQALPPIQINR